MRAAIQAFGRNLLAGFRLAVFMPVERVAFHVSAAQLLLVVILSAAIDIDADWVRAGQDARIEVREEFAQMPGGTSEQVMQLPAMSRAGART